MTKQARILDDARIIRAKEECRDEREFAILLLSLYGGLRAKEIAGLTWGDIDFHATGGTLLLKTTKGDKPRNVPMNKELRTALLAYRLMRAGRDAPGDRVIASKVMRDGVGEVPMTPSGIAMWLHYFYNTRLGWDGFSSHSGRRTFATRLARKGLGLKDLKVMMGHESMTTTTLYIDTDEEAQRRLVELI